MQVGTRETQRRVGEVFALGKAAQVHTPEAKYSSRRSKYNSNAISQQVQNSLGHEPADCSDQPQACMYTM